MNDMIRRRLSFVGFILALLGMLIVYRLISLQFGVNIAYFAETARTEYRYRVTIHPPRGEIYDRNGILLATNSIEYEIGISPVLILDREGTAQALANATGIPKEELLADMASPAPYVLLVRPATAAMGQAVLALELDGVVVTPIPRRFYPHGSLAAHVLGFVGYDETGYYGIEGYYDDVLRGKIEFSDESRIPFEATGGEGWSPGSDLYLTLDSEIQSLAEMTLSGAIEQTGASSGTIIVMDPRTGEILAMANWPTFDPNRFYSTETSLLDNPAINEPYEPGSTFKVLTMAIALENDIVEPDSTYNDTGVLEVGGIEVHNWDNAAHGITTMTDLLGKSLNVGAATLSLSLGPTRFYSGLEAFGLGELTGIDLQGEVTAPLDVPGSPNWYEADLATNAFGQGVALTPLQLITAVGAVANGGLLVQPHMVTQRIDPDGTITTFGATTLGRPISPQTAQELTWMLATALQREASPALLAGYNIAGKTGTAQIPIPGGYDLDQTIASFIGYGPIDDPRFIVLIKLDRPTSSPWGSQTAAPIFGQFVSRLVVLMEIPPDSVRLMAGR
jgi:cell division protein FtsI (penicillin-binding protein 3)